MRGKLLLFIGLLIPFSVLSQQDVRIRSGFVEDSLVIGQHVNYWLTASYPPDAEVLFPDSNFNFAPFEYVNKTFEPSAVVEGNIYDSAVYTLQSFDIEPIQNLSLPVIIFDDADSITVKSETDSIYFKDLVPVATDTTSLKTNFQYQVVRRLFNYPLAGIIGGALAVIALITLLVFGKRIRRALQVRKLRKDYQKFSTQFTQYIEELKSKRDAQLVNEVLSYWKKYYEKLESEPVTKLTTSEILNLNYTSELRDALKSIDRCIYGNQTDENIYRSFQSIEDFTQHRYTVKLEELKSNGRK